ncbi:rod shape-determining protein MreD [Nonomuraea phyllanthi]|uniref:rod shape-determining protein MreD n=1 Tax=Nonomuraea phyllanthi TaxID=2219224 RepID=UPI001293E370|nr:rod shape-determining protein MreD [Nonomuraea phyllanthi]QFY10956.1 rod shape-determining protein MreD [Nonomuraea phyllanthi]
MGAVVMVVVAPLLQVVLVNRWPWGGPDLVTLAVVWTALGRGPVWGCAAGLVAGLAADVTPPADGTVGRSALALAVTGLVAGHWRTGRPLPVAAAGAAMGVLLQAAAAMALGDDPWSAVVPELPPTLAWTVLLGAPVGVLIARRKAVRAARDRAGPRSPGPFGPPPESRFGLTARGRWGPGRV